VVAKLSVSGGPKRRRGPAAVAPPLQPVPRGAAIAVAVLAAGCVLALVTMVIQDTDLWTLLAQGRAIVSGHPPTVNQWTWPAWGEPQVASSWGFRPLLWSLWRAGGVWGVFAWRWISTLAVFGVLWAVARTMGARGLVTPVVLVACAAVYRERSEARPETLAAVLFALAFWILERWRAGRRSSLWAIPVIALVWINVHVSYYLLFALLAFYALDSGLRRRPAPPASAPRRLWLAAAAALAVSFVHPSGWRALWAPFDLFLAARGDPMFGAIEELQPLWWRLDWRTGLPALLLAWPLLIVWRARRAGPDRVEGAACVLFGAAAIASHRFSAVFAMAAAPFLARDLGEWAAVRAWPALAARRPALARGGMRAALAAAACLAIALPELLRADRQLGVAIDLSGVPVGAADFMAREGIRGRGFNAMQFGGYFSHRFWPDRERAPFVTTQPELSSPATRAGYVEAMRRPGEWLRLDDRERFQWVLLAFRQDPGDHLLDVLDRDTSWVMVFTDDAAELYVRSAGPFADVARRNGYRAVPGGREGRTRLVASAGADPDVRARAVAECERIVSGSPWNGQAHRLLGYLALMDGRPADARAHFEATLRLDPRAAGVRERLRALGGDSAPGGSGR
jgi:hypothetical protein